MKRQLARMLRELFIVRKEDALIAKILKLCIILIISILYNLLILILLPIYIIYDFVRWACDKE